MQMFMSPGEPTYIIQACSRPDRCCRRVPAMTIRSSNASDGDRFRETDAGQAQGNLREDPERSVARICLRCVLGFVDASNRWRQNCKNFKVNQGLTIHVGDVKF